MKLKLLKNTFLFGCVGSYMRHAGILLCPSRYSVAAYELSSHGLWAQLLQLTDLFVPWHVDSSFPGKGLNPSILHCKADS